jgi:hypothetical protein
VGGNLFLSYTKITSLPDNLEVGRNIYVGDSKIEYFKSKSPKFKERIR